MVIDPETIHASDTALGYLGLGGGVVALLMYLKRIFSAIGLESAKVRAETEGSDAVTAVIKTMREEIERLSAMNKWLSTEIASLQTCVVAIRREKDELRIEVERLNCELGSLIEGRVLTDSCYSEQA